MTTAHLQWPDALRPCCRGAGAAVDPVTTYPLTLDFVPVKRRARSGKGGNHYTPAATRDEEAAVALQGRRLLHAPLPGLWAVEIEVRRRRPGRKPGELTAARPREPDADNVVKAVLDALNGIAWEDDRSVAEVTARSVCAEAVGCVVRLRHLGAEGEAKREAAPGEAEFIAAVDAVLG